MIKVVDLRSHTRTDPVPDLANKHIVHLLLDDSEDAIPLTLSGVTVFAVSGNYAGVHKIYDTDPAVSSVDITKFKVDREGAPAYESMWTALLDNYVKHAECARCPPPLIGNFVIDSLSKYPFARTPPYISFLDSALMGVMEDDYDYPKGVVSVVWESKAHSVSLATLVPRPSSASFALEAFVYNPIWRPTMEAEALRGLIQPRTLGGQVMDLVKSCLGPSATLRIGEDLWDPKRPDYQRRDLELAVDAMSNAPKAAATLASAKEAVEGGVTAPYLRFALLSPGKRAEVIRAAEAGVQAIDLHLRNRITYATYTTPDAQTDAADRAHDQGITVADLNFALHSLQHRVVFKLAQDAVANGVTVNYLRRAKDMQDDAFGTEKKVESSEAAVRARYYRLNPLGGVSWEEWLASIRGNYFYGAWNLSEDADTPIQHIPSFTDQTL
jgi:hypothetical protein